ncbi:MAG: hypothetical protein AAF702_38090 [Chloroflexota bacterium]
MSDNITVFERYANKVKPEEDHEQNSRFANPVAGTQKPFYQAAEMIKSSKKQARLFIEYADGTKNSFSYAHLLETPCTSSKHLMLCFSHCILSLEGEGIEELLEPIGDQQVRYLHCYNSKRFTQPEDDALIIDTMTYESVREMAG